MGRMNMTISRRCVLAGALSAPAIVASTRLGSAAPAQTLKISHQFPGGTIDEGDFRDRLCRKFAAEVDQKFNQFLASKGVIMVSWIWQAGGVVSRSTPIVNPQDVKGLKVRGGSREMDMVLQAAGATTLTLPSNELYAAMQTGACDAAITSSTSLISFRLEEVAKSLTTGRGKSYWFMLEPLIMSKQIFDKLPKKHQEAIMAIGQEMETFGTKEAMADDEKVAEVYAKKGSKVLDLDE